ncbi:hypothetical protein BDR26DRAFT_231115 [Obelidium mucronatum]|nr:hypothetical protein BDR26DRAFT_231115 [Obelidium mucronatum]
MKNALVGCLRILAILDEEAMKAACGVLLDYRNFVETELDGYADVESGLLSVVTLLLSILRTSEYIGDFDPGLGFLVAILAEHSRLICQSRSVCFNDQTLVSYFECLTLGYGRLSESLDSIIPQSIEIFLETNNLQSHEAFTQVTKLLSNYVTAVPSVQLPSILTSIVCSKSMLVAANIPRRFFEYVKCFEAAAAARWEFIDESLWGIETNGGWWHRVLEACGWSDIPRESVKEKVVTVPPAWLAAILKAMEESEAAIDAPGSIICEIAIVLALIRCISGRSNSPTMIPSPSSSILSAIRNRFLKLLKRSVLVLAVSFDDGLQYAVGYALYQYFGLFGTVDGVFRQIIAESDSASKVLFGLLTLDLVNRRANLESVPELLPANDLPILSKALGESISINMSINGLRDVVEVLRGLAAFCVDTSKQWQYTLSTSTLVTDPKSTQFESFQLILFSIVMVLKSVVEELWQCYETISPANQKFCSIIARYLVEMLMELHFVTCRFGLDGFEPWNQVFYQSVDFLVEASGQSFEQIVEGFIPGQCGPEPTHYSNPRSIFFMLLVQHLLPRLSVRFLEITAFPVLQPYLAFNPSRSNDELDLFEMGHWIYYKLFDDASNGSNPWKYRRLVCGLSDWYIDLVLQNYLNGDSSTSTRRMISSLIKALTCFSTPSSNEKRFQLHSSSNEAEFLLRSGENSQSQLQQPPQIEARLNKRGAVREFKSRNVLTKLPRRNQTFEVDQSEVELPNSKNLEIESAPVDPWEGDDIAWKCIEKIVGRIQNMSLTDLGNFESAKTKKPSNKRADEILEQVPELKMLLLRDGLLLMLFDQIRTIGMRDLERLLELIRGLLLNGVVNANEQTGGKIAEGGLGLDVEDLNKSALWKGLFEAISNSQYFDQLRQVRCVEWYIEVVAEARDAKARQSTLPNTNPPATRILRAKL